MTRIFFDLSEFDIYKEDNRREVKKASGGLPKSLWESYSAFANTYGGVIILGVSERKDGSWFTTGLKNARSLEKDFWDTINNSTKVNSNLLSEKNVEFYDKDGDTIMVIYVPRARREERPIYINDDIFKGTYRRNASGDYRCTKKEVLGMLRDEPEETPDMNVIQEMSIDVISKETLHAYRNLHSALHPEHVWSKLPDEEFLDRIGAVGVSSEDEKVHPTAAGLLMFGEEYRIVREFPEYFLDFREMLDPKIRWTDRVQATSGDWSGNLFDFYFRVYPKLVRDLKVPFKLKSTEIGLFRDDDTPVHKAIREAFANCIVNSDFHFSRGIVILKDRDSIIFENPGSIRTGKEQMLRGGISDPRNKTLMKMFNMINIGDRAGSGVPDIYKVWEDEKWEEPVVEEQLGNDRTILKLSFKNKRRKQAKKTSEESKQRKQAKKVSEENKRRKTIENEAKIVRFLKKQGAASSTEIAEAIGLSNSRTRAIISKMEQIMWTGQTTNRKYQLK